MKINRKINIYTSIIITSMILCSSNLINKNAFNNIIITSEASSTNYNKTTFKEVCINKGNYAYIRSSGTVYADNIVGKLSNGEVVEVVRETINWYRVNTVENMTI